MDRIAQEHSNNVCVLHKPNCLYWPKSYVLSYLRVFLVVIGEADSPGRNLKPQRAGTVSSVQFGAFRGTRYANSESLLKLRGASLLIVAHSERKSRHGSDGASM